LLNLIIEPTFLVNSTLPYLGKNYKLKIIVSDKEEKQNLRRHLSPSLQPARQNK
jgi:hypothetical protein